VDGQFKGECFFSFIKNGAREIGWDHRDPLELSMEMKNDTVTLKNSCIVKPIWDNNSTPNYLNKCKGVHTKLN
jgi:hypothetical protein